MSIILTTAEIILILQITTVVGFSFLAIYTMISYKWVKNPVIFYISLAFAIVALSVILRITILPFAVIIGIAEEYLEAMIEAIQFLAALFFFYGLRVLKRKKEAVV